MQGVVPAAGEGTRLRPLTEDKPKMIIKISGQPLVILVFETLLDAGGEELVAVVGYEMNSIISHYGEDSGVRRSLTATSASSSGWPARCCRPNHTSMADSSS